MKTKLTTLGMASVICFSNNLQALTIEWVDNADPTTPFPANDANNSTQFNDNTEFRMITNGSISEVGISQ